MQKMVPKFGRDAAWKIVCLLATNKLNMIHIFHASPLNTLEKSYMLFLLDPVMIARQYQQDQILDRLLTAQ